MITYRTIITCLLLSLTAFTSAATDSLRQYMPHVHGIMRTRAEASLCNGGAYRFEVRNARVSLDGNIGRRVSYFIQTDFCAAGKIIFLDAYGNVALGKGIALQAGQFRMPMGVETFRAPFNYIFSNRSFIGKQMFNHRAVGIKASYTPTFCTPLTIEAGAFNPSTIITDHTPWNRSVAAAARAEYIIGPLAIEAGFGSLSPDSVRMNVSDASLHLRHHHWECAAEYMHKRYSHRAHRPSHAYAVWACYYLPLKSDFINRCSIQARADGLTAHSNGFRNDNGALSTTHPQRNRLTIGGTISHNLSKKLFLDLRLDYEKYIYRHTMRQLPRADTDKAVLEMVLRF